MCKIRRELQVKLSAVSKCFSIPLQLYRPCASRTDAAIPVVSVPGVAFDPVREGMHEIILESTLRRLANIMRLVPRRAQFKTALLQKLQCRLRWGKLFCDAAMPKHNTCHTPRNATGTAYALPLTT